MGFSASCKLIMLIRSRIRPACELVRHIHTDWVHFLDKGNAENDEPKNPESTHRSEGPNRQNQRKNQETPHSNPPPPESPSPQHVDPEKTDSGDPTRTSLEYRRPESPPKQESISHSRKSSHIKPSPQAQIRIKQLQIPHKTGKTCNRGQQSLNEYQNGKTDPTVAGHEPERQTKQHNSAQRSTQTATDEGTPKSNLTSMAETFRNKQRTTRRDSEHHYQQKTGGPQGKMTDQTTVNPSPKETALKGEKIEGQCLIPKNKVVHLG